MTRAAALLALLVALSACGGAGQPRRSESTTMATVAQSSDEASTTAPASPDIAVLLAAGDIASCDLDGDEATAALLDELEGTIATLGDTVYPSGTADQFAACYAPSWGRHLPRTRPAPGNHDYETAGAAGYFAYFGSAAGDPGTGWYSYELAAWHVVVLNSNCELVGGCHAGSPQETWLRSDLAANPADCTLAYWHHPRFSSGPHGSDPRLTDVWRALHDAAAELVLSGHDHDYERFAAQDADGLPDDDGIRQLVVGTGGYTLYSIEQLAPNSEAHSDQHLGVLQLTLHDGSYEWEFVAVDGARVDAGREDCH